MSAISKKGIAGILLASMVLAVVFCCTRPDPKVVGNLTQREVRDLQRMTAWSLRARDYRNPHPYASSSPVMKLLYRIRGATARMGLMKRPSVVPSMVYVVYRDRFDAKHIYVYYFESDGTNRWKFSSSRKSW